MKETCKVVLCVITSSGYVALHDFDLQSSDKVEESLRQFCVDLTKDGPIVKVTSMLIKTTFGPAK